VAKEVGAVSITEKGIYPVTRPIGIIALLSAASFQFEMLREVSTLRNHAFRKLVVNRGTLSSPTVHR